MLDFSFGEILVIAIVAVIFLGPDKLPQAFVKVAKFFKTIKKTINDAKETLDREIHISELKQDSLEYKKKFEDSAEKLKNNILDDVKVDSLKSDLDKNINEIKDGLNTLKLEDKLNEPLEQISFDEIEQRGKAMQNELESKKLAKPKRKTPSINKNKEQDSTQNNNEVKAKDTAKKRATKKLDSKNNAESKLESKPKKPKDSTKSKKTNKEAKDSTTKKRASKKVVESKDSKLESKSLKSPKQDSKITKKSIKDSKITKDKKPSRAKIEQS